MASSPSPSYLLYGDPEPPFLAIGTDVSAKYKGAFCEAKIKKVTRLVKCRITFKNNAGSVIVTDDNIKGLLRVGAHVEAKHPDKNKYLEGIINKIIDASQYTVVFDDGDEITLRRTSLCLKSGKHFAESESLDHLPLTNPEHFGNPVKLGAKRGRQRRRRKAITSAASNSSTISDAESDDSCETEEASEKKEESIVKDEPSETQTEADDDKKSNSNGNSTNGSISSGPKKGKRRGKIGRKKSSKAGSEDEDDGGDNGDKGFSGNMDSETESEAEYDSKIPTISKDVAVDVDNRIRVKYGKGKAVKIYEAKVLKTDNDPDLIKRKYFVHYTGWNVRYDEWIKRTRIVEVVKDKVTKRRGGSKMRKGISIEEESPSSIKDENEETVKDSPKERKETKETPTGKTGPPAKRGRPSFADKLNDSTNPGSTGKKKVKVGGKRKSKGDVTNGKSKETTNVADNDKCNSSAISKNKNDEDTPEASNRSIENTNEPDDEPPSDLKDKNADTEIDESEDTKIEETAIGAVETCSFQEIKCEAEKEVINEPVEVSVTPIEIFKEEAAVIIELVEAPLSNSSNIKGPITEDLLTCDENLAKSPMRSDSPERPLEIEIKSEPKEDVKSETLLNISATTDETLSCNEDDEKPVKLSVAKRKQNGKQLGKKEKERKRVKTSDGGDEGKEKTSDGVSPLKKKKPAKKQEESPITDDTTPKKPLKPGKKKRKILSPDNDEPSKEEAVNSGASTSNSDPIITVERENDTKGKKRKRSLNKIKSPNDISGKHGPLPGGDSKPREGHAPKKRFKKEIEEMKKSENEKSKERDKEVEEEKSKDLPAKVKEKDNEGKEAADQDDEENQEIASLFDAKPSTGPEDSIVNDTVVGERDTFVVNEGLQETGGSFLLCKEEVPASPPGHQMDAIIETITRPVPVSHTSIPVETSTILCSTAPQLSSSPSLPSSSCQLPSQQQHVHQHLQHLQPQQQHHLQQQPHIQLNISSLQLQDDKHNNPNNNNNGLREEPPIILQQQQQAHRDSSQFTPPTTPESLKSGTLPSSSPPLHERGESSDNEKNQSHIPNDQPFSSSELEVSKTTLASAISALDSLANAASGAHAAIIKECHLSSPAQNISEDSCSRNSVNETTSLKHDSNKLASPLPSTNTTNNNNSNNNNNNNSISNSNNNTTTITSIHSLVSPKKRRGRVRTSSQSETKETKSSYPTTGCKTRGSLGRKTRQYGESSNEGFNASDLIGDSLSPALPSLSLSNYSPNAFVYSVNPTSKYNFCTPIDESLETEKRIQILQDRLQDLRKTYINIKSEVASIERRRKKAKKKDKDSTSPISPTSSSASMSHSVETRNHLKDHHHSHHHHSNEMMSETTVQAVQSCTA